MLPCAIVITIQLVWNKGRGEGGGRQPSPRAWSEPEGCLPGQYTHIAWCCRDTLGWISTSVKKRTYRGLLIRAWQKRSLEAHENVLRKCRSEECTDWGRDRPAKQTAPRLSVGARSLQRHLLSPGTSMRIASAAWRVLAYHGDADDSETRQYERVCNPRPSRAVRRRPDSQGR